MGARISVVHVTKSNFILLVLPRVGPILNTLAVDVHLAKKMSGNHPKSLLVKSLRISSYHRLSEPIKYEGEQNMRV